MTVKFPEKLAPLFEAHRYKVIHGGRGSGKSWGVARALLLMAARNPLRWLCAREVQKSIKDSVHRLLSDQIQELGLGAMFDVLDTEIRGLNGSLFLFSGLSQHTVESVKSFEGVDGVWVEEGQTVSKKSWDVLIPTIRKPGSEIWITFNPDLETDETYRRFVTSPPPDCVVIEMNYSDNPFFPDVLESERIHCKLTNPDDYDNIWEGACRQAVQGAIYAREVAQAVKEGRIAVVPYDPTLKVHTVWDLGWNDSMTIIIAQRLRSEVRVIDYIEDSHKTLDWYAAELQQKRLNWGNDWLPHDGFSKDFKTGKTAAEMLKAFGRKVKQIPNLPVETGIKAARAMFPRACINKVKAERLIECLKRYRRAIIQSTNEPGNPVHDEFSHGADSWRYLSLVCDQFSNEDERPQIVMNAPRMLDSEMGY